MRSAGSNLRPKLQPGVNPRWCHLSHHSPRVRRYFLPSTQTICVALSGFPLLVCMFVSPLLSTELIIVTDGYAESSPFPGRRANCSGGRLISFVDSLYNPDLVLRYTRQVMMFTTVTFGIPMLHRINTGTELMWKRIKKSR